MPTAAKRRSLPSAPSTDTEAQTATAELLTAEESAALDDRTAFKALQEEFLFASHTEIEGMQRNSIAAAKLLKHKGWKDSEYKNFVDFCAQTKGWGQTYAYQRAEAGQVFIQLEEFGQPQVAWPTAVSQAVELRRLSESDRPTVWRQLVESTRDAGGKVTAEVVKEAVNAVLTPEQSEPVPSFEDVQAQYDALYSSKDGLGFQKQNHRRLHYAFHIPGWSRSFRGLKEAVELFEEVRKEVEPRLRSNEAAAQNTTQVTEFAPSKFRSESDRLPAADTPQDVAEVMQDKEQGAIEPVGATAEVSVSIVEIEDESDDAFAGESIDPFTVLESLVRRRVVVLQLGWDDGKVLKAANKLHDLLEKEVA